MNIEEASVEFLECARYGEVDDLRACLAFGVPVDFRDAGGNTALHRGEQELPCSHPRYSYYMILLILSRLNLYALLWVCAASANGEVECMRVLKEYGATFSPNLSGNTPLRE
jgi:ankyrin repeat protein